MTKRYSHLVPDTLKKAVDDVWGEGLIQNIVGKVKPNLPFFNKIKERI